MFAQHQESQCAEAEPVWKCVGGGQREGEGAKHKTIVAIFQTWSSNLSEMEIQYNLTYFRRVTQYPGKRQWFKDITVENMF